MLVFIINTYKDSDEVEKSIYDLKEYYPESKVVVIFDGLEDSHLESICKQYNVKVIHGEHLKLSVKWIERWMLEGLKESTDEDDWIVKYDPETYITGRLTRVPDCDVFCCTRANKIGFKSWDIQGGVQFIRRYAVEKILEERVLEDKIYTRSKFYSEKLGRLSDSWIFDHIIKRMKFFVVDHPEIFCCVKYPKPFNPSLYKMIHPRKEK